MPGTTTRAALIGAAILSILAVTIARQAAGQGESLEEEKPMFKLAELAWMQGEWRTVQNKTIIDETWLKPEGNTMLGTGQTTREGRLTMAEFLMIQETSKGVFLSIRHFGPALADFDGGVNLKVELIRCEPDKAWFGQPGAEKPRKITYEREGDILRARVDSFREDGSQEMFRFEYTRRQP